MRRILNGKTLMVLLLLTLVAVIIMLTGCNTKKEDDKRVRDLDFTVVGEKDIPQDLLQMIKEKQEAPFKMTYSDDQGLYIIVGYGSQNAGGYSVAVKDLYLTENAIVFDTELLGPEKGSSSQAATSYPYIVVKTEFLELPVIFQ